MTGPNYAVLKMHIDIKNMYKGTARAGSVSEGFLERQCTCDRGKRAEVWAKDLASPSM